MRVIEQPGTVPGEPLALPRIPVNRYHILYLFRPTNSVFVRNAYQPNLLQAIIMMLIPTITILLNHQLQLLD